MVIVPDYAVVFGKTFVFNYPDLTRRPIRLLASEIDDASAMRALCARHSVAILDPHAVRDVSAIWGESVYIEPEIVDRLQKISPAGCLRPYR